MSMPGTETELFGRPVRHFQVAISAGAQALAWARQESAPHGATVMVDREISPMGRRSRMWHAPADATLACAVVLRPPLAAEEGDAAWLVSSLAAAEGAEAASGRDMATWWPDGVVDATTGEEVSATKAEVLLGPGKVQSAVLTFRFDLERLKLGPDRREELLGALLSSLDGVSDQLGADDGPAAVAAAYEQRCRLIGQRVVVRLVPKGEARGVAQGIDRAARLELGSPTGMVERVAVDTLRELEVL